MTPQQQIHAHNEHNRRKAGERYLWLLREGRWEGGVLGQ